MAPIGVTLIFLNFDFLLHDSSSHETLSVLSLLFLLVHDFPACVS